jgi:hypothetical protein
MPKDASSGPMLWYIGGSLHDPRVATRERLDE